MLLMSMPSSLRLASGANFPHIEPRTVALNVPATIGHPNFSKSNLSLDRVDSLVVLSSPGLFVIKH